MNPRFEQALQQVDVLSLDIFDTTLGRRCAFPDDVFSIMEERLVESHGEAFSGFSRKRKEADAAARRRAWDTRQAEEILLEDIYGVLLENNGDWEVDAEHLGELETTVENQMLYPLDTARLMIRRARETGKRVIFISDMYLPLSFCRERLEACGFKDYDALYLSSEIGLLKHSGKLFEHVIADLGIKPSRILHVGDNPHSDGKQAEKLGIRTLLVEKAIDQMDKLPANPWQRLVNQPGRGFHDSILLGLSVRGLMREDHLGDPFWFRTGYQFGGPLVYGYVCYLVGQLRGRGHKKVYFLSRDGHILKQVYEKITTGMADCPDAEYLYASRRALNFASITELDKKTEDWLAEGINLSVGDFLKRIGLNPDDHAEAILESGFTGPDHRVVGGHEYDCLRRLYHAILPALLDAASRERGAYLDYLRSKGVLDQKPLLIVDVGWMTSIQRSFEKLLQAVNPGMEIEGFYVGTYPEAVHRSGPLSRHNHYLMNYGQPGDAMRIIRHSVCLVEFFFAAPEKTFLYMDRSETGKLNPVFAPTHENACDLPALQDVHAGILEYTDEMLASSGAPGGQIQPSEVLALLERLLANPTREEAERLGELKYADGYGSFFHHTCMARPGSFRDLGLSKRRWKKEFKGCHWPSGYYARLGKLERGLFRLFHPMARFSKPHG